MHIWIITSGNENIRLYNILNNFDIKTTIRYDSLFRPYGDKPFEEVIQRIEKWIEYLQSKNTQKIIISPVFELYFKNENKHQDIILPIFQWYLNEYIFKYSVVWKLWIAWNHCDWEFAQQLISKLADNYIKSCIIPAKANNQLGLQSKKDFSFNLRHKETSMRDYLLHLHSPRQNMINKFMKLDCRYFTDANIDTLIPMQYSYFMFEKWFSHTFFTHKTKFHWKKAFFDVFSKIINKFVKPHNNVANNSENTKNKPDNINVQIHFTGSNHLLFVQKKRERLICHWKNKKLKII